MHPNKNFQIFYSIYVLYDDHVVTKNCTKRKHTQTCPYHVAESFVHMYESTWSSASSNMLRNVGRPTAFVVAVFVVVGGRFVPMPPLTSEMWWLIVGTTPGGCASSMSCTASSGLRRCCCRPLLVYSFPTLWMAPRLALACWSMTVWAFWRTTRSNSCCTVGLSVSPSTLKLECNCTQRYGYVWFNLFKHIGLFR